MDSDDVSNESLNRKSVKGGEGFGAFGVLGLNRSLCFILEKKFKYKQPSAIQRRAIPAVLKRKDVVCIARTGSGKTAAYLAPLVQMLDAHSQVVGTRCLVLLPTRELALQVDSVLKKFINLSNQSDCLRRATLIGGQALETQFGALSFNPDIVLATPGRLSQHLVEKSFDMGLLEHFVIDEADKLFEMGFLPDVYQIFSSLPANRQTILVSATLPSALTEFVNFGLSDPFVAKVDKDMQISDALELQFIYCRSQDKTATLLKLLKSHQDIKDQRSIVFVATRHHVEYLSLLLTRCNISASAVHGKMDTVTRVNQLTLFQKLKNRILVVTDVGARGLDLPLIDNVINFDFPHSTKLFIHRVGRTARAGKSGRAISFVCMYDFAFCFDVVTTIGKSLEIAGNVPGDKNKAYIGSLGDLADDVEHVRLLLQSDEELAILQRSMEASYNMYYKVRPAASKSSIQRAEALLESMGGTKAISLAIHPQYNLTREKVDTNARHEILEYLHGFRPAASKQSLATIPKDSIEHMQRAKLYSRHLNSKNPTGQGPVELRDNNALVTTVCTDAFHDELKLPQVTLNITADAQEEMQKQRYQSKNTWNPKKKRFENVLVDTAKNKVVKHKTKMEKRDLLKRWTKTSHRRIQQVGEVENATSASNKKRKCAPVKGAVDTREGMPICDFDELGEMFPKHKGVFEAAKLNAKMTNKQKRTLKRLTSVPKSNGKNAVKNKSAKKRKRLAPSEFKSKLHRKIAKHGAPNRSKLLVFKAKG